MYTTAKRSSSLLKKGTKIQGRWHKHTYRVIKKLGSGTVGVVYLCQHQGKQVALKLSEQAFNMMKEVEMLRLLERGKVQDRGLGPYLLDVDDWQLSSGRSLSFYVMEYIQGMSLEQFVRREGFQGLRTVFFQLLDQLEELHRLGYVFGDLKSENIIVTTNPNRVRLIDVGGVVQIGRSVKEYTAFYDRAYWRLGQRIAEPSYDLFALSMVILAIFYPKKFPRKEPSLPYLRRRIIQVKPLHVFMPVLLQALSGNYKTVSAMRKELIRRLIFLEQRASKASPSGKEFFLLLSGASLMQGMIYVLMKFF